MNKEAADYYYYYIWLFLALLRVYNSSCVSIFSIFFFVLFSDHLNCSSQWIAWISRWFLCKSYCRQLNVLFRIWTKVATAEYPKLSSQNNCCCAGGGGGGGAVVAASAANAKIETKQVLCCTFKYIQCVLLYIHIMHNFKIKPTMQCLISAA